MIKELENKRSASVKEIEALNEKIKTEGRNYSADEKAAFERMKNEIAEIDTKLSAERFLDEQKRSEAKKYFDKPEQKLNKEFNMARALNNYISGRPQDGAELEVVQEAEREFKNFGQNTFVRGELLLPGMIVNQRATFGTSAGANLLAVAKDPNVRVAHNPIVYSQIAQVIDVAAGAAYEASSFSQLTAYYATESTNVTQMSISPAKKKLDPKLLVADMDLSKQLIAQSMGGNADQIINQFVFALDRGTDKQMFADLSGLTNTIATATTYGHVVSLDGYITGTANAFISSKKGKSYWETKTVDTGSGVFVWSPQGTVHGVQAYSSDLAPDALVAWGNFQDYGVARYGGIAILYDPYSLRKAGDIGLNVSRLQNQGIINPVSFAICKNGSFI
jgi:HK97 family phage major capsid protein